MNIKFLQGRENITVLGTTDIFKQRLTDHLRLSDWENLPDNGLLDIAPVYVIFDEVFPWTVKRTLIKEFGP